MPDNEKVAISEMFTLEPQSLITTNRDVKPISLLSGIICATWSFVFFIICQHLIQPLTEIYHPHNDRDNVEKRKMKMVQNPSYIRTWFTDSNAERWIRKNTLISFFHAFITGILGYFCYDTIDIISNQQGSELLEMMIHHALTLTLFGTSIIRRANIGYLMLALIVEINSVFLHLRKLFHQYNIPRESLIVRLTMVTNIITFLIFRFGLFIYGSITIFRDGERAGSYFHIFLGYILVPTIWIINIVLFYRLLYTDFLKKRKTK
ncbi:unnamed protein product [Rotaria socialis]|uniref:TLC domain-containing protein n=1 Tax=Rotaria socialis TaxID=392032 RepID=A0A819W8W6_9BILA|nr:unnamed protein product [Rotaria socialis]